MLGADSGLGNEHGKCGGIYDYRTRDKDYEPWCIKDCAGNEKIYLVHRFCHDFFSGNGADNLK